MTSLTAAALAPQLPEPEPVHTPLRDAPRAGEIDPASFRELFDYIVAKPDEMKWASIPWQTDLWEARRLVSETGRPIFMWAMNGNPLGCV